MPTISCTKCGQSLLVPEDKIGQLVRCPKCRLKFRLKEENADAAKPNESAESSPPQIPSPTETQSEAYVADESASTGSNVKRTLLVGARRLVSLCDLKFEGRGCVGADEMVIAFFLWCVEL